MQLLGTSLSRRDFLLAAGAALSVSIAGVQRAFARGEGVARLYRPESGERLILPARFSQDDLLKCSVLFRDIRDHDQAVFADPSLLEILVRLNIAADQVSGDEKTIHITSAYRTKKRNAQIEGAAKASLHTVARAADYTIPGFENLACAKLSAMVGAGGVGVYPGFSHLDSGKDRTWVAKSVK